MVLHKSRYIGQHNGVKDQRKNTNLQLPDFVRKMSKTYREKRQSFQQMVWEKLDTET